MSDWVKTLQSAKSFATASRTRFADTSMPSAAALQSKLFYDLRLLSSKQSGVKILFNVQMAAIHLYYILQGSRPGSTLVRLVACSFFLKDDNITFQVAA